MRSPIAINLQKGQQKDSQANAQADASASAISDAGTLQSMMPTASGRVISKCNKLQVEPKW